MDKRRKIREKFGLREEPCDDCLVTACCAECAISQEARELKVREKKTSTAAATTKSPPIREQPRTIKV